MILKQKISKKTFWLISLVVFLIFGFLFIKTYPDLFSLYEVYIIKPSGQQLEIEPKEKIAIKFNRPISHEAEKDFSIKPEISGKISFEDQFGKSYAQTITFKPDEYFTPDTFYQIKLNKIKSFYGTKKENLKYYFKTITSPKIKKLEPEKGEGIDIQNTFSINLDKFSPYFYFKFELEPNVDLNVEFKNNKNKFIVAPKNSLEQGREYILKISKFFLPDKNKNLEGKKPYDIQTFKYKTLPPITIDSFSPMADSLGLPQNQEIKVKFSRAVDYKSAERNFSIEPNVDGNLGWEKNTLIFQPKEFSSLTWYTVKIKKGIVGHNDNGYLDSDFEFKFQTKLNPAASITPKEIIEPKIKKGKYIDIDISQQLLTLFENGKTLGSYLVSTGTYDMPTPYGEFKILNKQDLAYSTKYDLYMPFWMAFTTAGHGIHELPFWKYKGGYEYKERESHLGIRVSHGCVRLGVGPAERVYRWADIGTPVVVHE